MAAAEAYRIKKKRNGRYMVTLKGGKRINGDDKLRVLVEKGLIKAAAPKPKLEEVPAEEGQAEEAKTEENTDA